VTGRERSGSQQQEAFSHKPATGEMHDASPYLGIEETATADSIVGSTVWGYPGLSERDGCR